MKQHTKQQIYYLQWTVDLFIYFILLLFIIILLFYYFLGYLL